MIAIVEEQEHALLPEVGDQSGKRIVAVDFQIERGCNLARHQARVIERRQIGEPYTVLIIRDQVLRDRQGERGLADTARSDDRNQLMP